MTKVQAHNKGYSLAPLERTNLLKMRKNRPFSQLIADSGNGPQDLPVYYIGLEKFIQRTKFSLYSTLIVGLHQNPIVCSLLIFISELSFAGYFVFVNVQKNRPNRLSLVSLVISSFCIAGMSLLSLILSVQQQGNDLQGESSVLLPIQFSAIFLILLGIGGLLAVNIIKGSAALKTRPTMANKVAPEGSEKPVKKIGYYSEFWQKKQKPKFNGEKPEELHLLNAKGTNKLQEQKLIRSDNPAKKLRQKSFKKCSEDIFTNNIERSDI